MVGDTIKVPPVPVGCTVGYSNINSINTYSTVVYQFLLEGSLMTPPGPATNAVNRKVLQAYQYCSTRSNINTGRHYLAILLPLIPSGTVFSSK